MACNIYITTESETKLKQIFCNAKDFYMLDIADLVKSLNIDTTKASGVYLINEEIQKIILSKASLKRTHGIFYIVQNINETLIKTIKQRLSKIDGISDFVLIDNGYNPKHSKYNSLFNDVIFYERFRRNKIIRCTTIDKFDDDTEEDSFEAILNEQI